MSPIVFQTFVMPGGIVATPGYSVFITPWAAQFAMTGSRENIQASDRLGGGFLDTGSYAQNNSATWNVYLETGTYKYAELYDKSANFGVGHIQLDTVDQGTIDYYAAGASSNNYTEITGISVTAGLKAFRNIASTKNASSSNYGFGWESMAWIRTGA